MPRKSNRTTRDVLGRRDVLGQPLAPRFTAPPMLQTHPWRTEPLPPAPPRKPYLSELPPEAYWTTVPNAAGNDDFRFYAIVVPLPIRAQCQRPTTAEDTVQALALEVARLTEELSALRDGRRTAKERIQELEEALAPLSAPNVILKHDTPDTFYAFYSVAAFHGDVTGDSEINIGAVRRARRALQGD